MRPVVTTRSLLDALEAQRRDESARRWARWFGQPRGPQSLPPDDPEKARR